MRESLRFSTAALGHRLPAGAFQIAVNFTDYAVVEKLIVVAGRRHVDQFGAHGDVFFDDVVANPAFGGQHRQGGIVVDLVELAFALGVFAEDRNRLLAITARVLPALDHAAKKLLPWIDHMMAAGEENYKTNKKPLFSSHMLDLSEESLEENIEISAKYFKRMNAMETGIEIELGVTGGEEDGVDNSGIDSSKLYTQPEDVAYAYSHLREVGQNFSVAASFGNVHGVYKPGNVKLSPVILKNSQEYVQKKYGTGNKPVNFVFHGGSGSLQSEIREAIDYGVIKMNIDTDMQWAMWEGVKNFYEDKKAYLQAQLGNPEGVEAPNKKYYDPRVWMRKGEENFIKRLTSAFEDLNSINRL